MNRNHLWIYIPVTFLLFAAVYPLAMHSITYNFPTNNSTNLTHCQRYPCIINGTTYNTNTLQNSTTFESLYQNSSSLGFSKATTTLLGVITPIFIIIIAILGFLSKTGTKPNKPDST